MNSVDERRKPGRISIIAAIGAYDRSLGRGGDLLWRIPDDLKRFKELTMGYTVVMGRKTWDSLPEKVRPLPGRTNVVVTRQPHFDAPGARVAHSLRDALAGDDGEVFVIGGGEIYREALPFADRLYLTLVDGKKGADAFFPEYENEFTTLLSKEPHEWEGLRYTWLTLERR